MVHHIPGAMRSNTAVSSYFHALFPDSVQKVTIMLELPELEALINKRDKVRPPVLRGRQRGREAAREGGGEK